jgi:hypothetical protein
MIICAETYFGSRCLHSGISYTFEECLAKLLSAGCAVTTLLNGSTTSLTGQKIRKVHGGDKSSLFEPGDNICLFRTSGFHNIGESAAGMRVEKILGGIEVVV